jgi:predicted metal-dependent hydrolase
VNGGCAQWFGIGARPPRRERGERESARRIELGGETLDYRLVRVRRRSIGIEIRSDGVTVRASRWTSIREIESALRRHEAWIRSRLAEQRRRRRDALPAAWKTGAPILFQGRELALAIRAAERPAVAADLLDLTVLHPAHEDERAVAAFVVDWMKQEALRLYAPRVERCAARIALPPPRVALSRSTREWGSFNRSGVIRLAWRLIHLPPELAQYVVAHEVAHLLELNHSPRFWALVETLHPGHREARRALAEWSVAIG